ncbi:MAG TPA: permease-like cell division protein FtsX [Candidatus Doudnabacteria bacterium]|nr:permease-like cell division protein FtsX [Candidatus Doudnabacteria bacterium]
MRFFISLFRIIKSGVTNLRRNIWLAAASTLIMTITLIILSVMSLLFIITSFSVQSIQERVDISTYFKSDVSEARILVIRDELLQDNRIRSINYVSSSEARQNFEERHQNDQLIIDSLNELTDNPFPSTLQIKAHNLEDYPAIADLLENSTYRDLIDQINFEDNRIIIERLNSLLKFIITFGLILMIVFCLIAVLVIFNTIALTIYNRREEVEIMRLVGATNWYIRGPFLVEALTYSVIAAIITSALVLPIYFNMLPKVSNYLTPGANIFSGDIKYFVFVVIAQLIIAFILSAISSLLAMRKYLRI